VVDAFTDRPFSGNPVAVAVIPHATLAAAHVLGGRAVTVSQVELVV